MYIEKISRKMINFYLTQVLSLPGLTNFCSADLIVALVTAGRLLYANSIFPCYLGMEINAKTRWTITKIVELGKKVKRKILLTGL